MTRNNEVYDHEGTLREMTISSADDEEQQAAEWALTEIANLRRIVRILAGAEQ